MENVVDVAGYIFNRYQFVYNEIIDETKIHKLLYFAQRESFAILDEPLFQDRLEGWVYGPVSPVVHASYTKNGIIGSSDDEISDESIYILNNVVWEYGKHSASHLSELSHKETSWINSRRGLASQMPGHNALKLTDIQEDAKKVRPYDHIWDMYYDEFEDAGDTEVGEV